MRTEVKVVLSYDDDSLLWSVLNWEDHWKCRHDKIQRCTHCREKDKVPFILRPSKMHHKSHQPQTVKISAIDERK